MLLHLMLACAGGSDADDAEDTSTGGDFVLAVDVARVALAYTAQGQPVPSGLLRLRNLGAEASDEPVTIEVEGPFRLEGYAGALDAGEERAFTVRFDGTSSEPGAWIGQLGVEVDGQRASVELVAVVGARGLPEAAWRAGQDGSSAFVALDVIGGAEAWLRVPEGLADDEGIGLSTWIGNDAPAVGVDALSIDAQVRAAGRNAAFVALAHEGSVADGALLERDLVAILYRDGWITRPEVSSRAWFLEGAAAAEADGWLGGAAGAVHLIEPSGAEPAVWAQRAAGGSVLRVLASDPSAFREAFEAAGIVAGDSLADAALDDSPVSVVRSEASAPARTPRHDRALQRLLRASGAAPLSTIAPELQWARAGAGLASLRWRADLGQAAYDVLGSIDGTFFSTYTTTGDTSAEVSLAPYLTVSRAAEDAAWSAVFAAAGGDAWFVDASDRLALRTAPTVGAPELLSEAGLTGSTWSLDGLRDTQERIEAPCVFWRAGASVAEDAPLDAWARVLLDAHAAGGGRAVLSGTDAARVADAAWLSGWGVSGVEQAASGSVNGWALGASYGVGDVGDALVASDSGAVLWTWDDGSAAAIVSERGVVVGFALEDLAADDRADALATLGGLCADGAHDAR